LLKARLLANPRVKSEYDALAPKRRRRSFATTEISDERVREIGGSRTDERHAHLDSKLEPK